MVALHAFDAAIVRRSQAEVWARLIGSGDVGNLNRPHNFVRFYLHKLLAVDQVKGYELWPNSTAKRKNRIEILN